MHTYACSIYLPEDPHTLVPCHNFPIILGKILHVSYTPSRFRLPADFPNSHPHHQDTPIYRKRASHSYASSLSIPALVIVGQFVSISALWRFLMFSAYTPHIHSRQDGYRIALASHEAHSTHHQHTSTAYKLSLLLIAYRNVTVKEFCPHGPFVMVRRRRNTPSAFSSQPCFTIVVSVLEQVYDNQI